MVRRLRNLRVRFNQLAAAVGEGRELSREAAATTQALRADTAAVRDDVQRLSARVAELEATLRAEVAADQRFRGDVIQGLRRVNAHEAWHRRRLREVRQAVDYEEAFADPEPLISVVIPTYERLETLRTRAIPSILAQEYRNIEIVIVGDSAPYGADEVREGFGDAPIRFVNLPMRGPYPEDSWRRWLVAGTPPLNEALQLARGQWIAFLPDDDAMRPHHLRTLLAEARRRRLEFVYGRFHYHAPHLDTVVGRFPPQHEHIAVQAGLLHGHLRFFEFELSDAVFGVPNDWGQVERMTWAGVRMGMVGEVVTDHYPGLKGMS